MRLIDADRLKQTFHTNVCGGSAYDELIDMQPTIEQCDDCVSRREVIRLAEQSQIQGFEWQIRKLVTLPSVTPTHDTCKNCTHYDSLTCNSGICLNPSMEWSNEVSATHYCRDWERRVE